MGRFSPEYTAWLEAAGWELKQQKPAMHAGKVEARYEYGRYPDKRRRDVANREKGLGDLLVKQGVLIDDCLIQRLVQEWSSTVPAGRVKVTITDWTGDN